MQVTCEKCGVVFQSKPAPCPDNNEFCCVAHRDKNSFICICGHNMGLKIRHTLLKGPILEMPGIAIINTKSIKKLEFTEQFEGEYKLEKYGVQTDLEKTKTADGSNRQVCPTCGRELEKVDGNYLHKCPSHGTEPFEVKK